MKSEISALFYGGALSHAQLQVWINGHLLKEPYTLKVAYDPDYIIAPSPLPLRKSEIPRYRIDLVILSERFNEVFPDYQLGDKIDLRFALHKGADSFGGECYPNSYISKDDINDHELFTSTWLIFDFEKKPLEMVASQEASK